jgi:hypothetical protein
MTTINDEPSLSTRRSALWGELLWLVPTLLATVFLVVLVLTVRDGGTVAAIIGVVLCRVQHSALVRLLSRAVVGTASGTRGW